MQDEHSLAHYVLTGISGVDAIVISVSFFQPMKYSEEHLVKMILNKVKMYCSKNVSKDREKNFKTHEWYVYQLNCKCAALAPQVFEKGNAYFP